MCGQDISTRGVFTAEVVSNQAVCEEHFLLRVGLAEFPPSSPGQFVQLQCRPPGERAGAAVVDWSPGRRPEITQPELIGPEPLLRRPLSLAGRTDSDSGVELEIIYRVVGAGTGWLATVKPRQSLSVLGPLGNSLPIIPHKRQAALIGGGVGIPPMIYLAAALGGAGKQVVAFNGARSKNLLPLSAGDEPISPQGRASRCCAEFERVGAMAVIASDDGSVGYPGLVTEVFSRWIGESGLESGQLVVYSCGPEAMMRSTGEICIERGIECYLSLERHMACGVGTCQSCVVKIRDESPRGWSYKLCCKDGPVFDARDVVW